MKSFKSAILLLALTFFPWSAFPAVEAPSIQIDERPLDRSNKTRMASYADMLDRATPAVVAVYTTRIIERRGRGSSGGNPLEDILRFYYGVPPTDPGRDQEPSEERVPSGVGSGVILSEDGYILTNNHVVTVRDQEVDEIEVQLSDGRRLEARIVGRDPATDIAVLKVDSPQPLPAIVTTNSDDIRVGDIVFAIGNPLEVGLTVTQGIVSATGRTGLGIIRGGRAGGYEDFIQTDASINMGNSGGALVDAEGRLIGINTAIVSRTGGNIGIGFAIPVNLARNVMNNLITSGTVKRGFLGVIPGNLTPDLVETFGLPGMDGAILNRVNEGFPADRAGLRHGDVIVAVDGRKIRSADELRLRISQLAPGTTVNVEFYRDGEKKVVPVVLGDLETGLAGVEPVSPLEGIELSGLDARNREEFNVPEEISGVLITGVERTSPFRNIFVPGMVILEMNRSAVGSAPELEEVLVEGRNTAYIWFRGSYRFLTFTR